MIPTFTATWSAIASAHRVHAGYAKADVDSHTVSIVIWALFTIAFGALTYRDPSIAHAIGLTLGIVGTIGYIAMRRNAARRHQRHADAADKYTELAENAYQRERKGQNR